MLSAAYNAPVSPPRRVLTSEDFVEVVAFRSADDINRPIDLTGCVIEAGLRRAGTSGPADLHLSSALDEIDVQNPTSGNAIVRVSRAVIAGLNLSGDYDFELRVLQDGFAISQVTSLRRFSSGVMEDRSALSVTGIAIDRSASFETLWQFRQSVFGVLQPLNLTDLVIEARLDELPETGVAALVLSTRDDQIEVALPESGDAIVRIPSSVTAVLQPGLYDLSVRFIRGETITILARATASVT